MLWKSVVAMVLLFSAGQLPAANAAEQKATFAGGCFWCIEHPFDHLKGVISAVSGYTGGLQPDPTYEQVSAGGTGHVEAVEITFDPDKISYSELLDMYWHQINPTDNGGQFADRGSQYKPVIFYHSEAQKAAAQASEQALAATGKFNKPIVVNIVPATVFYPAEDYHQNYAEKNPLRYRFYRYNSGRDQYLKRIWGNSTP